MNVRFFLSHFKTFQLTLINFKITSEKKTKIIWVQNAYK